MKVNGDILTQSDLESAAVGGASGAKRENPQTMSNAELTKALAEVTPQIIVDAVDELLLLQRGKELGYHLTDEKFKQILENIKKENKIETEEQLQQALKSENLTMAELRLAPREIDDHPAGAGQRGARAHLDHRGRGQGVLRRAPERVHDASHDDAAGDSDRGAGGRGRTRRPRRRRTSCARSWRRGRASRRPWPTTSEAASKANGGLIGPISLSDLAPALAGDPRAAQGRRDHAGHPHAERLPDLQDRYAEGGHRAAVGHRRARRSRTAWPTPSRWPSSTATCRSCGRRRCSTGRTPS